MLKEALLHLANNFRKVGGKRVKKYIFEKIVNLFDRNEPILISKHVRVWGMQRPLNRRSINSLPCIVRSSR